MMKKTHLILLLLLLLPPYFLVFACQSFLFEPNKWSQTIPGVGSMSSPIAVDLNKDGIKDIVIGAGGKEFSPTPEGVLALDGKYRRYSLESSGQKSNCWFCYLSRYYQRWNSRYFLSVVASAIFLRLGW